ncbi:hypothetical protein KVT40_005378 [Elsinoe batatas]|uniref:HORMA domain-containing protein n=1 Tax=Elsinoe batatas TaxID=2601811 RepID=A0A8K0L1E7_9PEZI|nr:hypothetical protein KVT40_005378 [Elsinoe batatas]
MAPKNKTGSASEALVGANESLEAAKIWFKAALSMIFYNRKLFPADYFTTMLWQHTPANLSHTKLIEYPDASEAPKNGSVVPYLRSQDHARPAVVQNILETIVFPELENRTLVALKLFIMEDPRHPNNVLESYTLMVEHDGLFIVDASHSPRRHPKSLAVITVIRSLARSFEDFQNFFVDMAPLPEQAYVAFQTLHTDRKTHPPIGMTETWGEPSVLPVKEGWKPQAYRPQAVHIGTKEYEALHLGAIAMKSSKSGNRVPIRTASAPSLAYTDTISAEKETTSMLFDAAGLIDKPLGHRNDDLDLPNGVTDSARSTNYQERYASLGDRGRKDHLNDMAEAASTGPTQADTQIRIPDTYDTMGEDSHELLHDATSAKLPAPGQDKDEERLPVMSCICGVDQAEGWILRCDKCQTGQHAHCCGYFDINLSMNEVEHICFSCAPTTKEASQERVEKQQSIALLRTLIHHLREEKPMTVKELSSKIDKDLDVTQDLISTLHSTGITSRKDRRRAQPLWTLTTSTDGIREMRRLYWSEVRLRKPAESPTPVIPRSPSAFEGRTRSYYVKRRSMGPPPNNGTPSKRAKISTAPQDNGQQGLSTTPNHKTRSMVPQTPRRSPRLAYQSRYQHDQVFLVSATFRTPPEAEG